MPRRPPSGTIGRGLRRRGHVIYAVYRGPDGRQVEESTETNDKRAAKAYRARRLQEVADGTWQPKSDRAAITVRLHADSWLPKRRKKIRSWAAEEKWLRLYILPSLGDVELERLRPKRVARWIEELQEVHGLSAASVRNAHGVLSALLGDAVFEEIIIANPAKGLPRGILPRIGRSTRPAFTRAQVLELLTCTSIDEERRMLYALAALGGLRTGEAVGRRWRDLEAREGLRALRVATQYNDEPLKGARGEDTAERIVPVHPELDQVLEEWRVAWAKHFGRVPRPDDWIVPQRFDELALPRTRNQVSKALRRDLDRAGVEHVSGLGMHSFRRWFISAAQAGGAAKDVVREITHRPKGDVLEDSYTRRSWAVLSAAVECLELALDDGADVIPATAIAGVDAGEHPGASRKVAGSLRVDGGGAGNRTPVRERSRRASTCVVRVFEVSLSVMPTNGPSGSLATRKSHHRSE